MPQTNARPEQQLYGFRAVYVFDVSQTEGKELPTLTEVKAMSAATANACSSSWKRRASSLATPRKSPPQRVLSYGGKITLLSGMQPAEEFSTLVHEMAHEMLHRGERRTLTTKQVRETEAEAVAFVVCQSIGLQNRNRICRLHPALERRCQAAGRELGSRSAHRGRDSRGHQPTTRNR